MILTKTITRFLSTTKICFGTEKSLLASLRKKTGYTFANCKKALEMHNNDVQKAEEWLKEQAQALGWSKATKLEGRQTTQGLIGVTSNLSHGVLVEVNCETDFVARNKEFQKIVEDSAKSCLKYIEGQKFSKPITKAILDSEQLKNLQSIDHSSSLGEKLVLMIGTVGENASLKRAFCMSTQDDIQIYSYAHPSGTSLDQVSLGRLGGLVALKSKSKSSDSLEEIGKGLCQHIVGMNPKKIGTEHDEPAKDKDDETCLIHQEYLLDDSKTVKELLNEHNIEIVDFKRFECGEINSTISDQPLEYVETCQ